MTNSDFDSWFKRDIWIHQEAACLFNELIPDDDALDLIFRHIEEVHPSKKKILEDYEILKRADWRSIGSLPSDCEERKPDEYLKLAEFKGIEVNEQLLDAHERHNACMKTISATFKKGTTTGNPGGNGPPLISNKMFNTLKPVIDLIEEFKNSSAYTDEDYGGTGTQQQLIEAWLHDMGKTKRDAKHIAKLISDYYRITTRRKQFFVPYIPA